MEVRTICDLRAERERQEEPHPELPGANHHFWNYDAPASSNAAISTEITPGEMRDRLIGFYRQLPWTFAPQFREVFVQVAAGRLPLVINCVAGKDRTGIACALLLGALGVPRPTVIEDYVLSERCVDYEQVMVQPALANGRNNAAGFGLGNLSVEQRAPVLRSDPDYITNALDAIDARHGSLNAYLDSALGVGEAMLADIRTHLLEETESEE
jgi:protein-tyrosine phosphatase